MLKETKTKETIGFIAVIPIIDGISIGGQGVGPWLRLWA